MCVTGFGLKTLLIEKAFFQRNKVRPERPIIIDIVKCLLRYLLKCLPNKGGNYVVFIGDKCCKVFVVYYKSM